MAPAGPVRIGGTYIHMRRLQDYVSLLCILSSSVYTVILQESCNKVLMWNLFVCFLITLLNCGENALSQIGTAGTAISVPSWVAENECCLHETGCIFVCVFPGDAHSEMLFHLRLLLEVSCEKYSPCTASQKPFLLARFERWASPIANPLSTFLCWVSTNEWCEGSLHPHFMSLNLILILSWQ